MLKPRIKWSACRNFWISILCYARGKKIRTIQLSEHKTLTISTCWSKKPKHYSQKHFIVHIHFWPLVLHNLKQLQGFINQVQPAISVQNRKWPFSRRTAAGFQRLIPGNWSHAGTDTSLVSNTARGSCSLTDQTIVTSVSREGPSVGAGTTDQTSRLGWHDHVSDPPVLLIFLANKWCVVERVNGKLIQPIIQVKITECSYTWTREAREHGPETSFLRAVTPMHREKLVKSLTTHLWREWSVKGQLNVWRFFRKSVLHFPGKWLVYV